MSLKVESNYVNLLPFPVNPVITMEDNLLQICAIAFVAVLSILSLLAAVIAFICKIFPVKATDLPDPGAEEAVRKALAKVFPDCRVSEIREIKP